MKKLLLILAAMAVATVFTGCNIKYSEGTRAGVVQKLSKKGFLCPTYEGELLVGTGATALPEKFLFSVNDEVSLKKVEWALRSGKPVQLTYRQVVFQPPCSPDTQYMITDVTYTDGTTATTFTDN